MFYRYLSAAVILVAMTQSVAARADAIENPAYKAWAMCKPGTSITITANEGRAGDNTSFSSDVTSQLKEVTGDYCTVSVSASHGPGGPMSMPDQKVTRQLTDPQQIAKYKDFEKTQTEETITVPAGTFKCKKMETAGPNGTQITLWCSLDVPGVMVKMKLTSARTNMTMEVKSIDKK